MKKISQEEEIEKRVEAFLKTVNSSNKVSTLEPRLLEEDLDEEMPKFIEKENSEIKISTETASYPGNYSALLPNFFSSYCPDNKICLLPSDIAFTPPPKIKQLLTENQEGNGNDRSEGKSSKFERAKGSEGAGGLSGSGTAGNAVTSIAGANAVGSSALSNSLSSSNQLNCTDGVLCIQISKVVIQTEEGEEEKVHRQVKYGSKALTDVHNKNGLHLIVLKRDPFYKKIREEIFDTHYDRREVERLITVLNGLDEDFTIILTSAGKKSIEF